MQHLAAAPRRFFALTLAAVVLWLTATSTLAAEPSTRSHAQASGFGQDHRVWAEHRARARVRFWRSIGELNILLNDPAPKWLIPAAGGIHKPDTKINLQHGGHRIIGTAPGGTIVLCSIREMSQQRKEVFSLEDITLAIYPQIAQRTAIDDGCLTINYTRHVLIRNVAFFGGDDEMVDLSQMFDGAIVRCFWGLATPKAKERSTGIGATHEAPLLIACKTGGNVSVIQCEFGPAWDRTPMYQRGAVEVLLCVTTGSGIGTSSALDRGIDKKQLVDLPANQIVNYRFNSLLSTEGMTRGAQNDEHIGAMPIVWNSYGKRFMGDHYYIDFRPIRGNFVPGKKGWNHAHGYFANLLGAWKVPFYPFKTIASEKQAQEKGRPINLFAEPYDFAGDSQFAGYVPTPLPSDDEIAWAKANPKELPPWSRRTQQVAGPIAEHAWLTLHRRWYQKRDIRYTGMPTNFALPPIDTAAMKPYPAKLIAALTRDGHVIESDGRAKIERFLAEQEAAMADVEPPQREAARWRVIDAWTAAYGQVEPLPEPELEPLPPPTPQPPAPAPSAASKPEPTAKAAPPTAISDEDFTKNPPPVIWPINQQQIEISLRRASNRDPDYHVGASRHDPRWLYRVSRKSGQSLWQASADAPLQYTHTEHPTLEHARLAISLYDAELRGIDPQWQELGPPPPPAATQP